MKYNRSPDSVANAQGVPLRLRPAGTALLKEDADD